MFPGLQTVVLPLLFGLDYGFGRGSVFENEIADLELVV